MTTTKQQNGKVKSELAPHDLDGESAVLGSILINPNVYTAIVGEFDLQGRDFFLLRHEMIFNAIESLIKHNKPIDNLTVAKVLESRGQLEDIGGPAYITELINTTPTSSHAVAYAGLTKTLSVRRQMLKLADSMKLMATDAQTNVLSALPGVEREIIAMQGALSGNPEINWPEGVQDYFEDMAQAWKGQQDLGGISSGVTALDPYLKFKPGELVLILGRPGSGKSSMLLTMWLNILKSGHRAGLWTGEMTPRDYIARAVAIHSGIGVERQMDRENLTEYEAKRIYDSYGPVKNLDVWMDDTPAIKLPTLENRIARWVRNGAEVIFLDHKDRMGYRAPDVRLGNIELSTGLADLAVKYKVCIVTAVQSSRAVDQRPMDQRRPRTADIAESSSWDQNAFRIFGLYRPAIYQDMVDELKVHPSTAEAICLKNRNGKTGSAALFFNAETTEFRNGALSYEQE